MNDEYFYTTIEDQIRSDGSHGLLYDHFEGEVNGVSALDRAYAKLYTILAAAATSNIPYHSVHIKRSDGILIDGRVFDRR
jgi:hypothetical protein